MLYALKREEDAGLRLLLQSRRSGLVRARNGETAASSSTTGNRRRDGEDRAKDASRKNASLSSKQDKSKPKSAQRKSDRPESKADNVTFPAQSPRAHMNASKPTDRPSTSNRGSAQVSSPSYGTNMRTIYDRRGPPQPNAPDIAASLLFSGHRREGDLVLLNFPPAP
ncbi:hypothetical protein OH77DRAFT_265062 [Trametes cingulata]|nr:hypothetical protein OH77DRAFT_265062 [Trametes cingulata]